MSQLRRQSLKRSASTDDGAAGPSHELIDKVPRTQEPTPSTDKPGNIPTQNRFQCLANLMETDVDDGDDAEPDTLSTSAATASSHIDDMYDNENAACGSQIPGISGRMRRPPPIYLFRKR